MWESDGESSSRMELRASSMGPISLIASIANISTRRTDSRYVTSIIFKGRSCQQLLQVIPGFGHYKPMGSAAVI